MAEQNVFNLMQNDEIGMLWKKIYQLHQKTKIYLLTAEEISENGDALIQPLKEHRDAYDHIVRIFASTTKKVPEGYDYYSYIKGNLATVYKGNIIKNLIMDCQSYTKYRPNETTGGIFVSWRRKEELPTGA